MGKESKPVESLLGHESRDIGIANLSNHACDPASFLHSFVNPLQTKRRPVKQNKSLQRPKPVPPRFHNDEGRRQLGFRISAENPFQFFMRCRQRFRRNSQVKHTFAQTLNEYQPSKILIARDEQPLLVCCPRQQAPVRRTGKIQFSGGDDIVTKITKQAASYRGPGRAEISRRHAHMNILRLNDINGVLDACLNVLHFEIGVIIPNNGFKRNHFPDQFENRLHRNARPGNTRFSKMNFGADLNSIHATSIPHSRHEGQAATWQINGCPRKANLHGKLNRAT
jgi:hypothetical protein